MNEKKLDFLLKEIAQDNRDAFETLYRETKKGVYAFLYPYFGNRYDTEDCMQTAFLKIKQSAHAYRAGTNPSAWMLQIAKNAALDEKRKRKRVIYTDIPPSAPAETAEDSGVFEALQRALESEERQIVILHVLWGYKHREIANFLNLPVGTVTSKYKRAVGKIKKYMKENRA